MKSDVPVPLRLLYYYVGLSHGYDVVKLWDHDPAELLKHEGLCALIRIFSSPTFSSWQKFEEENVGEKNKSCYFSIRWPKRRSRPALASR